MVMCCVATFATAQNMRVMSFNVRNGRGMDNRFDFDRTAAVITKAKPDVVAVQELDSMTTRNPHYLLGELAQRTGYNDYYAPSINYRGGKYGIGVLSKEKALSVKDYPLPCRKEPRGMLVVDMGKYYFIATHLSLVKEDQLTSVEIIRDVVSKLNKPVFFAGDLNARPNSATMAAFRKFMVVLNDSNKATFPADAPRHCIDYVMGANGSFKVTKDYVFYDNLASDHLPLYVDVKITKPKKSKKK